jgi:hypothetical protein
MLDVGTLASIVAVLASVAVSLAMLRMSKPRILMQAESAETWSDMR